MRVRRDLYFIHQRKDVAACAHQSRRYRLCEYQLSSIWHAVPNTHSIHV